MKFMTRWIGVGMLFALVLGGSARGAYAQAEMMSMRESGVPVFHYDVVNVAAKDPSKSRLNLFIKIANDELQFIREGDHYKASYEVSVVLFDQQGDQVDGKIWREEVQAKKFEDTNSRRLFSLTSASFDLLPATYKISVGLMDLDTKATANRKSSITLREFGAQKLAISDITYVNRIEKDSLGGEKIFPDVSGNTRDPQADLFAYFEIYSRIPSDSVRLFHEIRNSKNEIVSQGSSSVRLSGFRTPGVIPITTQSLSHDKYLLKMWVQQGGYESYTEKIFTVRWVGMPATISDLELAIEQLKYIADRKEMQALKKSSQQDRWKAFEEFWKKKDPTPGTDANELMDEYYRRVEFANENFSTFREGWKTDMGMIYIIFGPPNDIERHPFDSGYKPYEIWYYYELNRQFVFVDFTGFGEYRLTSPLWLLYR